MIMRVRRRERTRRQARQLAVVGVEEVAKVAAVHRSITAEPVVAVAVAVVVGLLK